NFEALLTDLEAAHARHGEVTGHIEAAGEVTYELVPVHFQADWAFHQTPFDHADNRYPSKMVETLGSHTQRTRQTRAGGPAALGVHEGYVEHGRILEMVRRLHHDGAIQALSQHLDDVLVRSLDLSADLPEQSVQDLGDADVSTVLCSPEP